MFDISEFYFHKFGPIVEFTIWLKKLLTQACVLCMFINHIKLTMRPNPNRINFMDTQTSTYFDPLKFSKGEKGELYSRVPRNSKFSR